MGLKHGHISSVDVVTLSLAATATANSMAAIKNILGALCCEQKPQSENERMNVQLTVAVDIGMNICSALIKFALLLLLLSFALLLLHCNESFGGVEWPHCTT